METSQILKYINNSATLKEVKEVEFWINASEENAQKYNLIKARCIVSSFEDLENQDIETPLNEYLNKTARAKNTDAFRKTIYKYAALIILFLGSSYYFYYNSSPNITPEIVIPENAITLKLERGNTKVIEENGDSYIISTTGDTIGAQKGNKLQYNNSENTKTLVYNTLTVPYGKRFDVVLSDNTHVFLNAGTSLKYPVNFIKGQKREVFLKGEAFFDVAKDVNHPFVVNASELNIKVLGTRFNVSAYPDDLTSNTVLVEGSVALYQEEIHPSKKATMLTPGHLASLNKKKKNISLEKVDTSLYTSWMSGTISFKHEAFKNILKKLERHYDVTISNNNKELDEVFFTASFDNTPLDYILQTFHKNYGIEYTINDTNITINN